MIAFDSFDITSVPSCSLLDNQLSSAYLLNFFHLFICAPIAKIMLAPLANALVFFPLTTKGH